MPRHRNIYLSAAVFLTVSAVWVAVRMLGGGDEPVARRAVPVRAIQAPSDDHHSGSLPASPSPYPLSAGSVAGPVGDEWGIPVGYRRSEAGARAAAVGWVSSLGALMQLGPIATADTLREMLTERIVADTIDAFRAEREQFLTRFGTDPLQAIWIESPLAVNTVEWNPDESVVEVWSQLLTGAPTATVAAMWRTHTVTLRWERDDWRVDDVTRVEGPTPQVLPGELPSPGGDFTALAEWTPAVLAGSSVEGA